MKILNQLYIFIFIFSHTYIFAQQTNIQYINDELNRLIQVTYPGGSIIQYTYDKVGNRTEHKIIGNATPPDLTIVNQTANPSTVGQGGTMSLSFLLQNAGQMAAGGSQTKIYISTTGNFSDAILIDSIAHNGVSSGGVNVTKNITVPVTTTVGNKYIILLADANNDLSEGNEENNSANVSIIVVECNSISATITNVTNATCNLNNGSATVSASGGTSYTYLWNSIPPITTSTANNLSVGTYTVTVTAQNGCSTTASTSITNTGFIPSANYTFTSPSQNVIQFTNTSSNDPTSYSWNFGDGFTSAQTSPIHTFSQSGTYNVCLSATNSCGSDVKCQSVQVSNGCEYPSSIEVGNIGNDSVTISWNLVTSAIGYNLRYKKVSETNWTIISGITTLNKKIIGLQQNTAYVYQVQSVCGATSSAFSNNYYFVTTNTIIVPPNPNWSYKYKLPDHNYIWYRSDLNSDGSIFISGQANKSGYNHGLFGKIDTLGNPIWFNRIDTCYNCQLHTQLWGHTPMTSNSNLHQCYYQYNSSNPINGNYVFKSNSNGDIIAERKYENIGFSTRFSFQTNTNTALLPGYTFGNFVVVNGCGFTEVLPVLVKVDTNLNVVLAKKFPISNTSEQFIDAKQTSDGNILCIGERNNQCNTGYKVIVTKVDQNLNILWNKELTVPGATYLYSAVNCYEDNLAYYTSCSFRKSGNGSNDTTIIFKVNKTNGDLIWIKKYFKNGELFSATFSRNINLPILYSATTNGFFMRINENGDVVWVKDAISTSREILNKATSPSMYFLGVYSQTGEIAISKHFSNFDSCAFENDTIIVSNFTGYNYINHNYNTPSSFNPIWQATNNINTYPIALIKSDLCPPVCTLDAQICILPDTLCPNQIVQATQISTGGATSFKWYKDGVLLDTTVSINFSFNSSGNHILKLKCFNSVGCVDSISKTIFVRNSPLLTESITNPTCITSTNGIITLTVSQGSPPYNFLWNNTATSQNLSSIGVGSYLVTVTDGNGCFTNGTYQLNNTINNPTVSINVPAMVGNNPNPYCNSSNQCDWVFQPTVTNSTQCYLSWPPLTGGNYISSPCSGMNGLSATPGTHLFKFKAVNTCSEEIVELLVTINSCRRYVDADGDGYGNPDSYINDCNGTPTGYVNNNLDCMDATNIVFPLAPELCDSLDNNCNDLIDEGCPYYFPPPPCVNWIIPVNASTNVQTNTVLKWNSGLNAIRYKLYLGTTNVSPFDIYDGIELTDTVHQLPALLPYNTTIYAKIVPYSTGGNPLNCTNISFTTQSGDLPNPSFVMIDTNKVIIKYGVFLKEASINNLKVIGSQTGLKSGVYSLTNDTITFTSSKKFRPGEQISIISKKEVKTIANQNSLPFSFERTSLTPKQGVVNFDTIGTGIILPNITDFAFGGSKFIDLNGDGLMDFVHLSTNEKKLYLYIRNSNGTFSSPQFITLPLVANLDDILDINNDGILDFVIRANNSSNNFYINYYISNGILNYTQSYDSGYNLYVYRSTTDFNNDGLLDMIYAWNANNFSTCSNCHFKILFNNGSNFSSSPYYYTNPGHNTSNLVKDIDNDGDSDILLTTGGNSFKIWQNNGLGVFTQATNIPSNGKLLSEIDLFNSDLNQDFVTINSNTEIFLNNSGINYNLNNPTQISSSALSVFRGDLDGDGDLDIMNGVTDWYRNNGEGTFTQMPIPGNRTAMRSFELFDYDNDGDLDQVFLNTSTKEVKILRNLSDRLVPIVELIDNNKVTIKYQKNILSSSANATNIKIQGDETGYRTGTFNVNGDLVTFTANSPFRAGEKVHITSKSGVQYQAGGNPPAASFVKHSNVTNLTTARFDTIGTGIIIPSNEMNSMGANMLNVNADNRNDVIYYFINSSTGFKNYKIFTRNANGTFATPITIVSALTSSLYLGHADFNNDGYIDFAFGSQNLVNPSKIEFRYGNSSGSYSGYSILDVPQILRGGKFVDLDGDGDIDLVIYSSSNSTGAGYNMEISILKNNGSGTFAVYANLSPSIFGNSIDIGDPDHDGDYDIFFTSNNTNGSLKRFRIYKNDGNGNFVAWIDEDNPMTKTLSKVDDFNADGNLDIITNSPIVELYFGNSQNPNSLTTPIDTIVSTNAIVHSGDVDGDGDLDLFIPNTGVSNSSLIKAFNNGDNTFLAVSQTGTILPNLNSLDMMDYDNDGDLDHLYFNYATGEIKVALNNCNYVKTLTILDSPLSGTHQAKQEIILQGNISVLPNTSLILKAPRVVSTGQFVPGNLSNILIDPNGCD